MKTPGFKKGLAIATLFFALHLAKAQYNTAIGLRAGFTSGLTVKHFFGGGNKAVEGIIGLWPYSTSITGLYEVHKGAGTAGLNFYYGVGAHVAFRTSRIYYSRYYDRYYRYYYNNALGIDGILGIEYKVPEIPFALSLDLKPFIEFHNDGYVYSALDPGLGLKIAF